MNAASGPQALAADMDQLQIGTRRAIEEKPKSGRKK